MPLVRRLATAATALALLAAAAVLLDLSSSLRSQRITVRYTAASSESERRLTERQLGLVNGAHVEGRTWSYSLQSQSTRVIAALIAHEAVEDTHHIDRARARVTLDDPGVPTVIRSFVEAGWSRHAAAVLVGLAAIVLWRGRSDLREGARAIAARIAATSRDVQYRLVLTLAGSGVALLLPFSVEERPDEALFVHLYEVPSILAGDHPYRDFFEWGAPLTAALSAFMQWATGYRLVGELLLQWAFIVAGVLVAVRLGLRHNRTAGPVLAVLPLIVLLAPRSGYHFSKLFCFPVTLWLAWRFLESPTPGRSAAMGLFTAAAFLFRHDYALWAALASLLALLLSAMIGRGPGRAGVPKAVAASYAAAVVVGLLPWLGAVAVGEGLTSYTLAAVERFLYERSSGNAHPYGALSGMNPWPLVSAALSGANASALAENWLAQATMVVPLALIAAGALRVRRGTSDGTPESASTRLAGVQQIVAGVVLAGACEVLLREWSYFLIVLPVTAALGSSFLRPPLFTIRFAVSLGVLLITMYAALVWKPPLWRESTAENARHLRQSFATWMIPRNDGPNRVYVYLRDCTTPSDRLLIAGSTPYYVPYYTQRGIAGGHLDWSLGLRNSPAHQAAALELLQRQSVPFVIARGGDALKQFAEYPHIQAYLTEHYAAVEGAHGDIMYDTRRPQSSPYGPSLRPCFVERQYR